MPRPGVTTASENQDERAPRGPAAARIRPVIAFGLGAALLAGLAVTSGPSASQPGEPGAAAAHVTVLAAGNTTCCGTD